MSVSSCALSHGVDFTKVYQRLPLDVYHAVLPESARQGLSVTGCLPTSLRPWEGAAVKGRSRGAGSQMAVAQCATKRTKGPSKRKTQK